jgi:PKD repeat protein
LTAADSLHRTANATTVVTVTGAFAASVATNVSSGNAPLTVGFTASGANGTVPYTFDWSFGDGSPNGSGTAVSHTYLAPGVYTATLVATDGLGVQRLLPTTITVAAAPIPLATTLSLSNRTTNCPSASWLTEATAGASGGSPPYVDSWQFGDGSSAIVGPVVNHSFARGGTFLVNLTTTDANGTTAHASERITVTIPSCRTPVVPPAASAAPAWGSEWAYVAIGAAVVLAALAVVVVVWRRRRRA